MIVPLVLSLALGVPVAEADRAWGPEQALGAPNTHQAGDIRTAWASATPDGQPEWLVVEYGRPVLPGGLLIHATYNPGAVEKVSLFKSDGTEVEAWRGKDPISPDRKKGISAIPLKADFPVSRVKIHFDSPAVRGWNEIDAVGLCDCKGETQWAVWAEASSTYARGPAPKPANRPPLPQPPLVAAPEPAELRAPSPRQPGPGQPPPASEEVEAISKLIVDLDSESFTTREEATRRLIAIGTDAIPALGRAVDHKSPEVRWRALRILLVLVEKPQASTYGPALANLRQLADSPNALVADKASAVLQGIEARAAALLNRLKPDMSTDSQGRICRVDLSLQPISGHELVILRGLTELVALDLSGTQVDNAALDHLAGCNRLEQLRLIHTPIGDAGLIHLKRMTALAELDLFATRVTNAGLVHLSDLANLRTLNLHATAVTAEGVRRLRRALPNCEIRHD